MHAPAACSTIAERAPVILVVDDDLNVLRFLTRMLGALGYEHVLEAPSITEAQQLFLANAHRIALVISDFVMPSGTGDTLIAELQRHKPNIPSLIISGNDPDGLISAIPLRRGVNFLQKPFTLSDMKRAVEVLTASA
jgi:two-component system, cell cycle sensor histidine kinase and response regulator CckA